MIARFGVEKAAFSHVDIVTPAGLLLGARDNACGGMPPGVWIRPPGYEKWVREVTVTFDVAGTKYQEAFSWAESQIGAKYDEDAIFGFILGQQLHTKGRWICSVLAGNFLRCADVIKSHPDNLQGVSPNTLFAMSLAVGGVVS